MCLGAIGVPAPTRPPSVRARQSRGGPLAFTTAAILGRLGGPAGRGYGAGSARTYRPRQPLSPLSLTNPGQCRRRLHAALADEGCSRSSRSTDHAATMSISRRVTAFIKASSPGLALRPLAPEAPAGVHCNGDVGGLSVPAELAVAVRAEIQRRPARSIRCTRRCARGWGCASPLTAWRCRVPVGEGTGRPPSREAP